MCLGDTKICAGTGGVDTCNGDSGGPILYQHPEVRYVLALVVWILVMVIVVDPYSTNILR